MKSAIIKGFFLSLNFEKLIKNTSKQQQRLLAVKQNAAKVNLVNKRWWLTENQSINISVSNN